MKAYALFLDDVLPELPGLTPELALHHIKRACNDFYSRSLCTRVQLPAIDVVTGTAAITLAHPSPLDFEIGKVLTIEYEGRALVPKTVEWMNGNTNDWDRNTGDQTTYSWRTQQGRPRFYVQASYNQLVLVAVPDHDTIGGLIVTVADQPVYSGAGIGDSIYGRFVDEISAGAKARLMSMPAKPWTNGTAAAAYKEQFEAGIGAAHAMASKGYNRATLRTRAWG